MSFIIKITQDDNKWTKEYENPVLLMEAIAESDFEFASPCGGRGTCGNCKVIVSGRVSEITESEKLFLNNTSDNGERLACKCYAKGNVVVNIPKSKFTKTIYRATLSMEVNAITENKHCFACTIDIGTTTMVFKYFSLPEGKLEYSREVSNPQKVRGSDVLTRIAYCNENGLEELHKLLHKSINETHSLFGKPIDFTIVTGNTAMLHIINHLDPRGMSVAPFVPKSLFGNWVDNIYYMPCVSSYIGADVVASLLSNNVLENQSPFALLDIGTNNECVLWDGNKFYACSSPAGPAFEGANISVGVSAQKGAIYRIENKNGSPIIYTIGNIEKPIGFCGSGLIDAVAYLYENEYISFDGSINKSLPNFGGLQLSGEDIAELQMAKAAVCAGLLTLCKKANINVNKLERIYLTGSFGSKINPNNLEKIGMLPKGTAKIAISSPFGASEGADMLLLDKSYISKASQLAKNIETVELANDDYFAKAFIENLYFK